MKALFCFCYAFLIVISVSCKSVKPVKISSTEQMHHQDTRVQYGYAHKWIQNDSGITLISYPLIDTSRIFYGYNGKDSVQYIFNSETDEMEMYILEETRYAVVSADSYYLIRFENR